ncbi:MAG: DegT/DnrJ/EryC1/StrS family aminotransferase [Candidatus Anstonellales archaeon]
MNILLDLNIVVDLMIAKRERHPIAHELYELIEENQYVLWIAASSVDNLKYILFGEAKRYGANMNYVMELFRKYLKRVKIFSVTGLSIREALDAKDLEDHIIYKNFKRVAPDGIVISRDENFIRDYPDVITSEEFINRHKNIAKPQTIPMLDLKEEYRYMLEEIDHAVLKNIADTKYILGPEVKLLEDKVREYLGVTHCIGCSSGTDALVLSLRALAIKLKGKEYFDREDEIITTPFTFTATGDAILRAGATPVFVDIDINTYNINPSKIREYLATSGKNVVGIIPVHLYGQSCQMDEIMDIAKEYNLFVVEDVAQAFGGKWRDKKLGSIGAAGCFSFFPSKNLGGFGDGGMVATNDNELAELIRMLIKHGGKDKYNVDHIGYNARLDTLQAAVLLAKFKYIDEFNERRRKIAEAYNRELANIDSLVLPIAYADSYHVYHQYTVRVKNGKRDELQKYLKDKGISTMVYYPVPLHKMKVFEGRCKIAGTLKNAEEACQSVLSLPIEPLQVSRVVENIVEKIRDFKTL